MEAVDDEIQEQAAEERHGDAQNQLIAFQVADLVGVVELQRGELVGVIFLQCCNLCLVYLSKVHRKGSVRNLGLGRCFSWFGGTTEHLEDPFGNVCGRGNLAVYVSGRGAL